MIFFYPKNLKSENNNPSFKPWFDILLHKQSIVCATVDSECLEYLGYITLKRPLKALKDSKAAGDNNLCIFSWIWIDFPTIFGKGIVYCTTLDSTGNRKNTTTFCSYYVFYFLPLNISNTVYNFTTLVIVIQNLHYVQPCKKSWQWIMYTVQTLISLEPKGKFVLKIEI